MDDLKHYPSDELKEYGERVASALFNASIQKTLGGVGGCKDFNLDNFDPELHPYVLAYVEGGTLDSIAIIYAAMRKKEGEV